MSKNILLALTLVLVLAGCGCEHPCNHTPGAHLIELSSPHWSGGANAKDLAGMGWKCAKTAGAGIHGGAGDWCCTPPAEKVTP